MFRKVPSLRNIIRNLELNHQLSKSCMFITRTIVLAPQNSTTVSRALYHITNSNKLYQHCSTYPTKHSSKQTQWMAKGPLPQSSKSTPHHHTSSSGLPCQPSTKILSSISLLHRRVPSVLLKKLPQTFGQPKQQDMASIAPSEKSKFQKDFLDFKISYEPNLQPSSTPSTFQHKTMKMNPLTSSQTNSTHYTSSPPKSNILHYPTTTWIKLYWLIWWNCYKIELLPYHSTKSGHMQIFQATNERTHSPKRETKKNIDTLLHLTNIHTLLHTG